MRSGLLALRSVPQLVERREVEVAERDTALRRLPLDAPEPPPELVVRGAQRRF